LHADHASNCATKCEFASRFVYLYGTERGIAVQHDYLRAGSIDLLDAALIELLATEPRVGVLEASRRLGVARGTVQARLDRMRDRGVITGTGCPWSGRPQAQTDDFAHK
jgi:GNAT superfamily N-acetyltransferase